MFGVEISIVYVDGLSLIREVGWGVRGSQKGSGGSGRVGEWGSGRVGEWASRGVGEWGSEGE